MGIPPEYEAFYNDPAFFLGKLCGNSLDYLIYVYIPIIIAMILILGIAFLTFIKLSSILQWDLGFTKKEKTSVAISSRSASGLINTSELKKRLEIELELLGEMVAAREERLEALKDVNDDGSFLEVENVDSE
ncbi:hypothetical protein N7457_006272 [Penicillium paradoxum]|uniref:uncharacterized protein n=1 Tax=Penicillium paradoxum TaxID=176176 RepID=UPI0025467436|nr:uncharacterized protein N7457_006272 [Penicillium paradoxum]KAJ5781112.1 hypothetical protein N7457_006272 [Penicillium paradoxum]